MAKVRTVESEIERLTELYKELPPKKFALAEGLIVQAARLRVRLDSLWKEIEENGDVDHAFTQSKDKTAPYERERPVAKVFTATDKNYQAIIRQLDSMLPPESAEWFAEKFNKAING